MGFSAAPVITIEPLSELEREIGHAHDDDGLPLEIRFLEGRLPADVLSAAARRAREIGVTAEAVLLAEGRISSELFYRTLAAALAIPFAEMPLRPAVSATLPEVLRTGVVALRPNPQGWRFLAAPRGASLRRLIQVLGTGPPRTPSPLAMTSPERLDALIRHDRRSEVLQTASHGLATWDSALSARAGITPGQALALLAAALLFCTAAWFAPLACLIATEIVFTIAFLLTVGLRLLASAASTAPRAGPVPRMRDVELPTYSVIVPLFREARVVKRLVAALDRLDYPREKLEIMLVVEASDRETLATIERLRLPARYRTVVAPPGRPQTKPRALNVALQFVRGQFVVIYDAEDEPEPGQLRTAARRFADDPGLACLQARLAIDNIGDSWLTALFALEYAALFHVVNPGLTALGLPIPLGGTSNHFRIDALQRVNGWDAWNVTEDIDLGIRLARFGLRVGSLDSTTFEEAPNTLDAWLKQRCRWMKGWMVTLGTLSRTPLRLLRDLGALPTLAVVAMLFGTVASSLLGPFCLAFVIIRACTGNLFWATTTLDRWWNAASLALLVLGVASAAWPIALGLSRRGLSGLTHWLALYPVYLVLLCLAAWQAAFEVFGRPHSWAKTEHGRAKHRLGPTLSG